MVLPHPRTTPRAAAPILSFVAVFSFFSAYTGGSFYLYPVYALMALSYGADLSVGLLEILWLACMAAVVMVKLLNTDLIATVALLKYFFGFTVFYLFFRQRFTMNVQLLLLLVALSVVLEALFVNTVLDPKMLPNYPDLEVSEGHITALFGFYQRPYGLGGSSTVTSTILLALMLLHKGVIRSNRLRYRLTRSLGVIGVILCASGTGMLLLLLYFILTSKNKAVSIIVLTALLALASMYILAQLGSFSGDLLRVSPEYMEFLIDYKIDQVSSDYALGKEGFFSLIFGYGYQSADNLPFYEDFAWITLYYSFGLAGILLYVIAFIAKSNAVNRWPLLIFLLGAFHYGAIFSVAGQILFSYCLSLRTSSVVDDAPAVAV